VPLKEYLIGAVAAEMPADYSVEALKAQAVCCHSYALSLKLTNKDKPELNGAWLTVNPTAKEGYITKEIMQTLWQTDFNTNYAKIQTAVDEVVNVVATFNGSPALTCYHAISAGQTENSANVWQQELPYLTGTDSTLDVTSPNFLQTQTFTPQQMYDALIVNFTGLDLTCDPANWFGEINYSTAGYATSLVLNKGVTVEGKDFRNALCLASTALEIEYADDRFVITTKGYGHGVGLSQYGANALALTGKTYSEILQHYFVGIMLSE
ncbi:MAG: stage II sporulation protein D, partial [Oscillospiraceae bacterium]